MKKFIKEHKKELAIAAGLVTVGFVLGMIIGQRKGEDDLVEVLIHKERCSNNNWPVYTSSDKRFGELMFEVKAECIGD